MKRAKNIASLALVISLLMPFAVNASVEQGEESLRVSKTQEEIGHFKAIQQGNRVYVYEDGKQIFRTNGNPQEGQFKDMFVLDGEPFIVVKNYNGYIILRDANLGKIGAHNIGKIVPSGEEKIEKDRFIAEQKGKRVYVYENGKQIFRTNGDGDDGTLVGMFINNDKPYIIVSHYKKGLIVLTDANTGSISSNCATTIQLPITYTAKQSSERVIVTQGQEAFIQEHQIFRTNGSGDNGVLKDAFLIKEKPFVMVQHYKKGNIILSDANGGSIGAKWCGNYYDEAQDALIKDGFTATYDKTNGRVVVTDLNNKQVYRTNGEGDNGTLHGLFVDDGQAYIIVKHYKKGLTVLGNKPMPNNTIGTQLIGILYE